MKGFVARVVIVASVLAYSFPVTAQPHPPGAPPGLPFCARDDISNGCPPAGKPHIPSQKTPAFLTIASVSLKSTGPCTPGTILGPYIYVYTVVVRNSGQTTWTPPSWAPTGTGFVQLTDQHTGYTDWHGQNQSLPKIAPGAQAVVQVGIPYYSANPSHMAAVPTHPFASWVWTDNVKGSAGPKITLPAPKGCIVRG